LAFDKQRDGDEQHRGGEDHVKTQFGNAYPADIEHPVQVSRDDHLFMAKEFKVKAFDHHCQA